MDNPDSLGGHRQFMSVDNVADDIVGGDTAVGNRCHVIDLDQPCLYAPLVLLWWKCAEFSCKYLVQAVTHPPAFGMSGESEAVWLHLPQTPFNIGFGLIVFLGRVLRQNGNVSRLFVELRSLSFGKPLSLFFPQSPFLPLSLFPLSIVQEKVLRILPWPFQRLLVLTPR